VKLSTRGVLGWDNCLNSDELRRLWRDRSNPPNKPPRDGLCSAREEKVGAGGGVLRDELKKLGEVFWRNLLWFDPLSPRPFIQPSTRLG
jgi:hypothetical protein